MARSPVKEPEIIKEEDELLPVYSIASYGADYPVDALVKRIRSGDIYVPTFQREFVWSLKQASRFIESLLLGLPVPGIVLAREVDTNRHLVIDGQQRLISLTSFYNDRIKIRGQEKVFSLTGVLRRL